jgi:acyl dehydratase
MSKNLTLNEIKAGVALPPLSHEVTATTVVLGALASRDWRPMHHDKDFAVHRNGIRDIFINTPTNAAWFERYITDWTGPKGRLGRIKFKMKSSVFPGDTMTFSGNVVNTTTDDSGCGWVDLKLAVSVGDKVATECEARVAVPLDAGDNPWQRRGERWKP